MDDVARELSVSKKTLYQYFDTKDALVSAAVAMHMEGEREEFSGIRQVAENAIQELFLLSRCMREHVFKINPSLLYDLQKYHPDAWEIFQQFKKMYIIGQIRENIERGVKEGYYRQEINPEVLAILRMEAVQIAFNEQVFPRNKFDLVDVQMQVFDHFVHGLLSAKGKELYQHYQQQEEKS